MFCRDQIFRDDHHRLSANLGGSSFPDGQANEDTMSLRTAGADTYEDSEILQTKKKNEALTEEDLGKISGGLSIARGKRNPNDQGRVY
jgi:hypothetical protein